MSGGILVVAEHFDGALGAVTLEAVGAATALKGHFGGPLAVVVVGRETDALAAAANVAGVDEILTVERADSHFDAALYEAVMFSSYTA